MKRIASIVLVAAIALTGLAGCGRLRNQTGSNTSDLAWDGQALQSLGYDTADLTSDGTTTDGTTPAPRARHPRLRFVFQHALHAEATVQTDEGTKTVDVQRGTVTAIDATSVTVQSTDGFTLTWASNDKSVVIVNRARAQLSAVAVGTKVGLAGTRDGDTVTFRLLVVPKS
jgi:hypothetical protein